MLENLHLLILFLTEKILQKSVQLLVKQDQLTTMRLIQNFIWLIYPVMVMQKSSQTERKKWGKLINDFFSSFKSYTINNSFIDSRHKPTELDIELNSMLQIIKSYHT